MKNKCTSLKSKIRFSTAAVSPAISSPLIFPIAFIFKTQRFIFHVQNHHTQECKVISHILINAITTSSGIKQIYQGMVQGESFSIQSVFYPLLQKMEVNILVSLLAKSLCVRKLCSRYRKQTGSLQSVVAGIKILHSNLTEHSSTLLTSEMVAERLHLFLDF